MKLASVIHKIALWATCAILAYFLFFDKGCNAPIDTSKYISKELYDASQDTLHKFRNKFGQEETKTKLLTGTVSDLKSLSASKDSSIQKLIRLVNKKTISATVLSSSTSGIVTASTTVSSADTVRKDSLIYVYPKYTLEPVVTKWDSMSATATKDSFKVQYKVFNEFEITQNYEKQKVKGKWFKQDVAMVNVKNLNPKTETRELKSFALAPPKKKQGKAFVAGALVVILAKQIKQIFFTK